jgi:hypothetical protein
LADAVCGAAPCTRLGRAMRPGLSRGGARAGRCARAQELQLGRRVHRPARATPIDSHSHCAAGASSAFARSAGGACRPSAATRRPAGAARGGAYNGALRVCNRLPHGDVQVSATCPAEPILSGQTMRHGLANAESIGTAAAQPDISTGRLTPSHCAAHVMLPGFAPLAVASQCMSPLLLCSAVPCRGCHVASVQAQPTWARVAHERHRCAPPGARCHGVAMESVYAIDPIRSV